MPGRGGPQSIPRPDAWAPGRPAPWAALPAADRHPDLARVRATFPPGTTGRPSPVAAEGAGASAVLVPLYRGDDGLEVVLTRRSWQLRTHRGEVSFPGGRSDPGETPVDTALREAHEEVGLPPDRVEPLGELDHLTTVTRRAYIVPVVGVLTGRPELLANDVEVDAVLHVPLAELLRPDVYREERWGEPGSDRPMWFFELVGDTVWGATAAMLRQLLARLTGTDPGPPAEADPAREVPASFRLLPGDWEGVV